MCQRQTVSVTAGNESSGSRREDTPDFAREVNDAQVQMHTSSANSRPMGALGRRGVWAS
jgi:hypothetical protein